MLIILKVKYLSFFCYHCLYWIVLYQIMKIDALNILKEFRLLQELDILWKNFKSLKVFFTFKSGYQKIILAILLISLYGRYLAT